MGHALNQEYSVVAFPVFSALRTCLLENDGFTVVKQYAILAVIS